MEKKLPDKLQFFENLIAKSTAPEGWMFNKVRMWDMSYVNSAGQVLTFICLLVYPTCFVGSDLNKCQEEGQTLLSKCTHDFCKFSFSARRYVASNEAIQKVETSMWRSRETEGETENIALFLCTRPTFSPHA